jgi:hypothetical protein
MKENNTSHIQLDWYNVRYRTLMGWLVSLVLLAAAGGSYFYYQHYYLGSPKGAASTAIDQAQGLLKQAERHALEEPFRGLFEDARRFLDHARGRFQEASFEEARIAAIRSQNYSRRLLDSARSGQTTGKEVRFYKIEGDTKVKRAGQFLWEAADPKLPLSVGDQIKTANNATAQIIYFDGTITTIKPGSLLQIKELYENPTTKVRKVREKLKVGGVSSSMSGDNVAGSFHEVSTDTVSARAHERSEIEIGIDKKKATEIRVHSGKAAVVAGKKEIQVKQSEMVAVDQSRKLVQRRRIPTTPELLNPQDQKVFVYDDLKAKITQLAWKKVGGAKRYHLQISRRSLLGELLLDKTDVRTPSVKLPRLKAGSYYWRVATVNAEGVSSAFSETRKFKIVSKAAFSDRQDKTPPPIEIKDFLVFSYQVIINGKTEPGAVVSIDGRNIDVYDDGTFTAVIKLKREGKNVLKIVAQDLSGNEKKINRVAYVEAF